MGYPSNSEVIAADHLRSIVERVERLREQITDLNSDVSEVYKEARSFGFDVRTIKALVSERAKIAKDPAAHRENEALLELYREALERGMVPATRVRAHEDQHTDNSTRSPVTSPPADAKGGMEIHPSVPPTPDLVPLVSHSPAVETRGGAVRRDAASPEPDLPTFLDRRTHG